MEIKRSDQETSRLVDSGLNEDGKQIAIQLYRLGFTLLDPNRAGYYIPGYNTHYTYALNVSKTRDEAEALLEQGMSILNEYGIETGTQTIEAPDREDGLFRILIVTNYTQVRDYDQSTKKLQGATTKTKGALKTTLGEKI